MGDDHATTESAIYRCMRCRRAGARYAFRVTFDRLSPVRIRTEAGDVIATHPDCPPPLDCPGCGRELFGTTVRGRLVESVACGTLCRNATGPSCDCSCGGANHGQTWAA